MSVLAVGLSHHSAPVDLLERASLSEDDVVKLLAGLVDSDCVAEAMALVTCNRVEVYADVTRFHGGVERVTDSLAAACSVDVSELTGHLYVHYEDKAVEHLFTVAAGLDSMVLGEAQILGQLRSALALARDEGAVGRQLGTLGERALRAGKRAQTETGIGAAGRSLVSVGVDLAAAALGGLNGRAVVVVGAGSISSLTAQTLHRAGADSITVLNRTLANAERLAAQVDGVSRPVGELVDAIASADLVVSCTGATGLVVVAEQVADALARRAQRPLVVLDLALPRDVERSVRELAGVTLIGLDELADALSGDGVSVEIDAARRLVTAEVSEWLARQRADRVAPTLVALRSRASAVVDAELTRLIGKLPELDERGMAEVRRAMNRTVDKLLHGPTVRIKELAEAPGSDSYAQALRDLFALDPQTTESVARAAVGVDDEAAS